MPEKSHEYSYASIVLGVLVFAFLIGVVIGVPSILHTRVESRKIQCKEHLRRISGCFTLYEKRYHAYPAPDERTWFGSLWTSGIATDPEIFRCPLVESNGPGTHFMGITGPGVYTPTSGTYTWTKEGITDGAPPDLAMACDDDQNGVPNHGARSDRNVLFFSGRVESFDIGSPTENWIVGGILHPTTSGWAAPAGTK